MPLIILTIIIVTLILGILRQEFATKKLINDTKNISISKVMYHGSEIYVDENELIKILNKYNAKKAFQEYYPYQSDKIDIEIDFVENNKPRHILLGEFNIWYESSDKGAYNILDGKKLRDELISILK